MYLVVHTVPLDPEGRTSSLSEIHIIDSWGYKVEFRVKDCLWVRALSAHSVPPLQSSAFSSCCIGKDEMPRMTIERSHPGYVSKSYFSSFVSNCIWLFLVYRALTSVAYTHTESCENLYLFWHVLSICIHRHISVPGPRGVYLAEPSSTCSGWALRSVRGCASELHYNGSVD